MRLCNKEDSETSGDAMEDSFNGSEDDVIEVENPNLVIPDPIIEVSSESKDEPEIDYEPSSVNQPEEEAMNEDFDPEEDLEEPAV